MEEKYDGIERYKEFWIGGDARMVGPYRRDFYVGGAVYRQGLGTQIIEITRFQLQSFTVDSKEKARQIGFEICRMLIDNGFVKQPDGDG
jgi:hypothetical protein